MDPADRPFLNVAESFSGQSWEKRMTRTQAGQAQAMTERLGMEELLARILAARGVEVDEASAFLDPKLRDLMPDPSKLTDMDAAADRLADAVEASTPTAIFGDYDVDGATSSALIATFLRHYGVPVEIYIPDRIFEGYGPNENAICELAERGARLLVTVDCGSTSHAPLAVASELGVDTIVLDHHQVGQTLPPVAALVNPNRQDDLSGQGHLCAAGVVFLTLVAIQRALRQRGSKSDIAPLDLRQLLDLVALGTVCDVVPLKGLNRAFVTRGIEIMRKQRNIGLAALARVARQDGPAAPWHLGFVLGPRINAGGRIGDAALGARLLTTSDADEAESIAQQLDVLNGERQAIETKMLAQAIDEADAEMGLGEGPSVLVTQSETWHAGVVGLLASRLKDRFSRPTFAIAFDGRGIGQGSGRSIPGCDLGRAVREAVEAGLLLKGGGHAMAAGVTIERGRLSEFRAFMEEQLCDDVTASRASSRMRIDGALSARAATVELFDKLMTAGPYGAGHPQPVLAFPRHVLKFSDVVGKGHVRFSAGSADGAELRGISFRTADTRLGRALLEGRGQLMHFAGTLSADFFRGARRVQLRLIDAAPVEA